MKGHDMFLEEKITNLKKELISYASLVENMIVKSIEGLVHKKKDLLDSVMGEDEDKANDYEIALDQMCANFIAQYEPKARDLRTILMVLKMNNDFERLADHAVNISQSALFLIERPQVKPLIDLPKMAEIAKTMLKESVDAFVNENTDFVQRLCERDSVIDDLREKIYNELIDYMRRDPSTIERSQHLIRITNNIERIADLSTNIGEDVMYMVEGKVIKHHRQDA